MVTGVLEHHQQEHGSCRTTNPAPRNRTREELDEIVRKSNALRRVTTTTRFLTNNAIVELFSELPLMT